MSITIYVYYYSVRHWNNNLFTILLLEVGRNNKVYFNFFTKSCIIQFSVFTFHTFNSRLPLNNKIHVKLRLVYLMSFYLIAPVRDWLQWILFESIHIKQTIFNFTFVLTNTFQLDSESKIFNFMAKLGQAWNYVE